MLAGLQGWAASKVFELVATGVVIAALGGWLLLNNYKQRQIGAQGVLTNSREFGEDASAKAEQDHAAAQRTGAAERLRARACRDCKP